MPNGPCVKSIQGESCLQLSDCLKVTSSRLSEIQQEQRKTTDASKRQVIVAPAGGVVMNLRFMSRGTGVSPRELIAYIVAAEPRPMVEADAKSLAHAGEIKLQAGMPAEVFIKGEQRTPLQYLVEPVTQVLRRAGREQ